MRAAIFLILVAAPSINAQVIVDGTFRPDLRRHDLQAVADEVWMIVRDLFGHAPPIDLPIRCYFKPDFPMTSLDNWSQPGQILVGINITESQWDQFAYQLGHELGHVMMNPRRSDGIIETLCMALAYEVLDRLYAKWGSGAPYANGALTSYGHNFKAYREQDERLLMSRLPSEMRVAFERKNWIVLRQYLQQHHSEQEQLSQAEIQSQRGRDIQTLGAIVLRSRPIAWKDLWNLGGAQSLRPRTSVHHSICLLIPSVFSACLQCFA